MNSSAQPKRKKNRCLYKSVGGNTRWRLFWLFSRLRQDMSITLITQTKLTYVDFLPPLFSIYVCIFKFMFTLMFLLMHVRNRICIRVSFSFSLSACSLSQRSRGLTFIFAHVLVCGTCRRAKLATLQHSGPHREYGPRSHAHFGCATTACVIGAPFPSFDTIHVRKPRSKKLAIISL